jgi:prepilin-type N-terminal cleavage/methylation domain-containing protein
MFTIPVRGGFSVNLPLQMNGENMKIRFNTIYLLPIKKAFLQIARRKGFTLIELLIVIAIIGLLGSLAAGTYGRTYIIKARLTEATNSMATVASAVASYYQERDSFPANIQTDMIQDSLGIALPNWTTTARFSRMEVVNGVITATVDRISDEVDGRTLVLRPTTYSNGAIKWDWDRTNSTIQTAYVPKR